jgi:hypothetical protein
MKNNRWVFLLLLAAGLVSVSVFLATPLNKYSWMLQEPSVPQSTQLPEDSDALMRLALFASPAFVIALVAIVMGIRGLIGRFSKATLCFGVLLLLILLIRVFSIS